jgi:hypothetical protein
MGTEGGRSGRGSSTPPVRWPWSVLLAAVAIAAVAAGCSLLPGFATPPPSGVVDPELPLGVKVFTPPAEMEVHVSNGTTIPVTVTVGDSFSRDVAPGQGADLTALDLPSLPWDVRVRTASGRVLLELPIRAGAAWRRRNADGSTESQSPGARVDLSCGLIVIWSGGPRGGPAPGPGVPGDCAP